MNQPVPEDFPRDLDSLRQQFESYFSDENVLASVRAAEQFFTETLRDDISRRTAQSGLSDHV